MPVSSDDYGVSICKALGIDVGGVLSVSINFEANRAVTATIVKYLDEDQTIEAIALTKEAREKLDKNKTF
jgi:hypothetical protein